MEIDKFSQLSWAQKSVHELYWNNGRQNTRSGITKENKEESDNWEKSNRAQIGYGEITRVSKFQISGGSGVISSFYYFRKLW
jgi:hypothetical protein